jgi:3-deoxy-manno-octulosonate cytidylyltransferase (CMP-KDO synthetase)
MPTTSANAVVVIPSRFGSSRLPGKPLLRMLGGAPMIAHVVRAALGARSVSRVLVATDHEEIAVAAARAGAETVMTDKAIQTGTDRVAAAMRLTQTSADIVVNVQGDEPLIEPESIDLAVRLLLEQPQADIATLSAPLPLSALLDPSKVKVVCSSIASGPAHEPNPRTRNGANALFFSRAPIGVDRETLRALMQSHMGSSHRADGDAAVAAMDLPLSHACRLHVGLYAFRSAALLRFVALPPSHLERLEQLEQMRALEDGMRIVVGEVDHVSRGVDTVDDLEALEARWRADRGLRESLRTWLTDNGYAGRGAFPS